MRMPDIFFWWRSNNTHLRAVLWKPSENEVMHTSSAEKKCIWLAQASNVIQRHLKIQNNAFYSHERVLYSYQSSFCQSGSHIFFNYENPSDVLAKSWLLHRIRFSLHLLLCKLKHVSWCIGLRRAEWQTVLQAKDESSFSECFYTYRLFVWGKEHDCIFSPLFKRYHRNEFIQNYRQ